ncbi:hypothetical protein OGAPHI_004265 [Ogataea philodendri]|uniref:Secreted protein n=1 Tax=Ogataea philodendri TaxID=1378263 RepID=A0A9P8T4T5_9ASCO|nr:uncharacterized protein OGAPHI_004265 [Ogataea philodendri]KAH3666076.1 hypothetical protein OGAPHI_004265 [Ogataea philodendri]
MRSSSVLFLIDIGCGLISSSFTCGLSIVPEANPPALGSSFFSAGLASSFFSESFETFRLKPVAAGFVSVLAPEKENEEGAAGVAAALSSGLVPKLNPVVAGLASAFVPLAAPVLAVILDPPKEKPEAGFDASGLEPPREKLGAAAGFGSSFFSPNENAGFESSFFWPKERDEVVDTAEDEAGAGASVLLPLVAPNAKAGLLAAGCADEAPKESTGFSAGLSAAGAAVASDPPNNGFEPDVAEVDPNRGLDSAGLSVFAPKLNPPAAGAVEDAAGWDCAPPKRPPEVCGLASDVCEAPRLKPAGLASVFCPPNSDVLFDVLLEFPKKKPGLASDLAGVEAPPNRDG